jgi:hypothetical protein
MRFHPGTGPLQQAALHFFAPLIIPALQIRYWQTEQEDANALRAGANNENLKCPAAAPTLYCDAGKFVY